MVASTVWDGLKKQKQTKTEKKRKRMVSVQFRVVGPDIKSFKWHVCPVPLTVRGTQTLVSFAPLAFKLFCAARQNAVLRRSSFPPL